MKKYGGTRYNSAWDGYTRGIIAFTLLLCLLPLIGDFVLGAFITSVFSFAFVLVTMLSVYYKIDGDQLIVYQFFMPTALPISKISKIAPTKTWLAGPAASFKHRLAITFCDRKVLRSMSPLVISPVRRREFIGQLLAANPDIKVEGL